MASAMGTTFLANTYQTANTAPNLIFELVAAGVLTSVFVPTFVSYLVRGDEEGSWNAANALASVALVGLIGLSLLLFLLAPVIVNVLLVGVDDPLVRSDSMRVGTELLRLFAPQVVFYGAGMIMTGALHARRRFWMPAAAPIFNNLVVIIVYLLYAASRGDGAPDVAEVTGGQVLLLGLGTTMGVVAMTVVLAPQLRQLGWRFRWSFDTKHPAVRKGARLGVWALGYAGGYQAGLIAVLVLANRIEGGVAAYQWAFTFFYLPHALVGVPLFNVLFTAMSEHAARRDMSGVARKMSSGLTMLFFILLPVAAACVALGPSAARVALEHGAMSQEGSLLVGRTLAVFGFGLPAYSAFLVTTRAFYALEDAKTPALFNAFTTVLTMGLGATGFFLAPDGWEIPGLAAGHSIGFTVGAFLLVRALSRRVGSVFDGPARRSVVLAVVAAVASGAVMVLALEVLPEGSITMEVGRLLAAAFLGALSFFAVSWATRSEESARLISALRSIRKRA